MSEPAVEERQSRASDIAGVLSYTVIVLPIMLAWVYVPA
jgi:hypothetical protein